MNETRFDGGHCECSDPLGVPPAHFPMYTSPDWPPRTGVALLVVLGDPSPQPPPLRGEGEQARHVSSSPPLRCGEGVGGRGLRHSMCLPFMSRSSLDTFFVVCSVLSVPQP